MNSSYFFCLYLHLINQKTINFSNFSKSKAGFVDTFSSDKKIAEIRVKNKQKLKTQSAYALLAFSGLHKASEFVGGKLNSCLISHVKLQQSNLNQSETITRQAMVLNTNSGVCKVDALTNLKKYVDLRIAPVNSDWGGENKSSAITWSFNKRILNQSFKSNLQMNLKSLDLSSKYILNLENFNPKESKWSKKVSAGRLGHNLSLTTSTPLIELFSGSKAQEYSIVKPSNQITGLYTHFNGQNKDKKTNKKASVYSSSSLHALPSKFSVGIKDFPDLQASSNSNFSIVKFYTASWLLDFICGELSLRNANIKRVLSQAFIFPIKSDLSKIVPDLIKGLKITFSGRMGGKKGMAKTLTKTLGRVPLSTLREKVDFAKGTVKTKVGSLGVKVWICYH